MSGYDATSIVAGNGETQVAFVPRAMRHGKRVVLLAHGDSEGEPAEAGGSEQWIDGTTFPNLANIAAALARAGFLCIAADFGGAQQMGASPAPARCHDAFAYAVDNYGSASDGPVGVGASMGGATLLQYYRSYPAELKAVYGIYPAYNLGAVYTENSTGLAPVIGSAWGVTYPAALPVHADPTTDAAAIYSGIPGVAAYSTADTLVQPQDVTAFCALAGYTPLVISTTLNHSDALGGQVPLDALAAFLLANGA